MTLQIASDTSSATSTCSKSSLFLIPFTHRRHHFFLVACMCYFIMLLAQLPLIFLADSKAQATMSESPFGQPLQPLWKINGLNVSTTNSTDNVLQVNPNWMTTARKSAVATPLALAILNIVSATFIATVAYCSERTKQLKDGSRTDQYIIAAKAMTAALFLGVFLFLIVLLPVSIMTADRIQQETQQLKTTFFDANNRASILPNESFAQNQIINFTLQNSILLSVENSTNSSLYSLCNVPEVPQYSTLIKSALSSTCTVNSQTAKRTFTILSDSGVCQEQTSIALFPYSSLTSTDNLVCLDFHLHVLALARRQAITHIGAGLIIAIMQSVAFLIFCILLVCLVRQRPLSMEMASVEMTVQLNNREI